MSAESGAADPFEPIADLVLSAEVARAEVREVVTGTVRIGKRVVTETRTITVQVRREELYVEHIAAPQPAPDSIAGTTDLAAGTTDVDVPAPHARGEGPVLTMVLHEEIPEITTRTAATERVSVFIDRVEGAETVSTTLRHEELAFTEEQSRR